MDEAQARDLISRQCPELDPVSVSLVGHGWDNTVFRVNDEWVFRFPRRQLGADCLESEKSVLPRLAGHLPIAVPVFRWFGQPGEHFPWPFSGAGWIDGRSLSSCRLQEHQRGGLAEPLAEFLQVLHAVTAEEARGWGVPLDRLQRLEPSRRIPQARDYLQRAATMGLVDDPEAWNPILDQFVHDAGRPLGACLVHGDLYARHLLLDEQVDLRGIIDWGDTHVGDRALDLAAAWLVLPPADRVRFRNAYGSVPATTWRRARFRAVCHAAIVAVYAAEMVQLDLQIEAQQALAWVLEE